MKSILQPDSNDVPHLHPATNDAFSPMWECIEQGLEPHQIKGLSDRLARYASGLLKALAFAEHLDQTNPASVKELRLN
jgi:hypothetical protein